MFEHFEKQAGYHLFIIGDIKRDVFDPMNVIVRRKKELHQKFITILINSRDYTIRQPVIAYYNHLNKLEKLHLVLQEKPVSRNDMTTIFGVGDINGILFEKNGSFYLKTDGEGIYST
jgi:repressor of nif and glnA expression